jgi:hypothetical protein
LALPFLFEIGKESAVSIIGQVWRNFSGFWKSQIFWTVIASMIALGWQYHEGLFAGSIRNNLWAICVPYIGIAGIFLVANAGHAILGAEWKAFKKRQHEEHRAERKVEMESSKPPVHKPNLQFRRVFPSTIFLGHEISGHSYDTIFVEIGNELLTDRTVGTAMHVKAHVTYLDKTKKQLQVRCPGFWTSRGDEVTIPTGESKTLLVAIRKASWMTDAYQGVPLEGHVTVQVRLLDEHGQLMTDVIRFRLQFGNDRYPVWRMG